jgi:hypothetical protein
MVPRVVAIYSTTSCQLAEGGRGTYGRLIERSSRTSPSPETVQRLRAGRGPVATKPQRHEADTKPRSVICPSFLHICQELCLFVSSGLGGARPCPFSAATQCWLDSRRMFTTSRAGELPGNDFRVSKRSPSPSPCLWHSFVLYLPRKTARGASHVSHSPWR